MSVRPVTCAAVGGSSRSGGPKDHWEGSLRVYVAGPAPQPSQNKKVPST